MAATTSASNKPSAGLPVFGAQAIVQLDSMNGVEMVLADLASTDELDSGHLSTRPAIGAQEATARARTIAAGRAPGARIETRTPRLALFAPELLNVSAPMRLVWLLEAGIPAAGIGRHAHARGRRRERGAARLRRARGLTARDGRADRARARPRVPPHAP